MTKKQIAKISAELQALQRQRAVVIKSRIMQANRLQAVVAGTLGYSSGMSEAERAKKMGESAALIKRVCAGEAEHPLASIILTTQVGIDAFDGHQKLIQKEMVKQSKTLPVASWVEHKDQRGFGLLFLAIVVGETGDLFNYANPAKVWRRLGCAPYSFDGKTAMGSTWRYGKEGKLPKVEWEEFGYSPRRRSIAYLIGEGIVKQNQSGPYRQRYDAKKQEFKKNHPDYSDKRCHLHGMLLGTKLLLKNLWIEWHK